MWCYPCFFRLANLSACMNGACDCLRWRYLSAFRLCGGGFSDRTFFCRAKILEHPVDQHGCQGTSNGDDGVLAPAVPQGPQKLPYRTHWWLTTGSFIFHIFPYCMGFVFPDTCQLLPPGSWCLTPTPSWYSPVWWTVWCHPRAFSWRVLEANIDVVGGRYRWQQLEIGSDCTWSHVIHVFKYQTSSRIWDGLRWLEDLETCLMAPTQKHPPPPKKKTGGVFLIWWRCSS